MKRVLLVEDDESNRVTLSVLLEEDAFAVDLASSFAEASAILGGTPPQYDAILLDHSLGDGYGSELIPLIRRALPMTKVVAIRDGGRDSQPNVTRSGVTPHTGGGHRGRWLRFATICSRIWPSNSSCGGGRRDS